MLVFWFTHSQEYIMNFGLLQAVYTCTFSKYMYFSFEDVFVWNRVLSFCVHYPFIFSYLKVTKLMAT